jgi:hypothetical protein
MHPDNDIIHKSLRSRQNPLIRSRFASFLQQSFSYLLAFSQLKMSTPSYTPPSLTKLAESILANSKVIESFLFTNNLPQPSFDANGPKNFPVGVEHTEIYNARNALVDATKELRDLVIGPRDTLNWMAINVSP